jgi:signal transduction histidine kinase
VSANAGGEVGKEVSILRGLALFGAAWQLLWLVSDSGLRTIAEARPTSPPMLLLAISALAWVAVWPSLFGRWRSGQRTRILHVIIVASLFVAGLGLIADPLAVNSDGWYVGASVVNLAAGLAGLFLSRRLGVWVVIAIVVGETIVVAIVHARGFDDWPISVDLVYPLYALALGLASVASRYALVTSARAEDVSSADLEREQRARFSAEQADASVSVAETRLHESVLNTLTAIVRGGLGNDRRITSRMQERAAEAAGVLQRLSLGADVSGEWTGDLRVDMRSAIDDLRQVGVRVELVGVLAPDVDPADPTYRAIGWAVREALLNVARHAAAQSVRIAGDLVNSGGQMTWRVHVSDDGRGFDDTRLGFGTQSVVLEGMERAGGRARIASNPGQGTDVLVEVPLAPATGTGEGAAQGPLSAIGGPVLVAFTAFTLFVVGATWQYVRVPQANLGALIVFAILVGVLGYAIVSRQHERTPWWALIVVLAGVPVMSRLETLGDAIATPTGAWTAEAGAALLFIVVAAGPWWVAPLALLSWLIGRSDVVGELTQPGTMVIVVAAILGWSLRRADARTMRLRADTEAERTAAAASRQRLSEAGHRYAAVDTSALINLLRAIARGKVDPTEATVREECNRQERMIRSVLPLHPERIALHRDLVQLAVLARERDIDLSINAATQVPTNDGLRGLDDAEALLALGRPGTTARASTTKSGSGCVFRLVVSIDPVDTGQLPESAEVLDEGVGLVAFEEVCTDPSSLDVHGTQRDSIAGV